jgi:hypothetical protein
LQDVAHFVVLVGTRICLHGRGGGVSASTGAGGVVPQVQAL